MFLWIILVFQSSRKITKSFPKTGWNEVKIILFTDRLTDVFHRKLRAPFVMMKNKCNFANWSLMINWIKVYDEKKRFSFCCTLLTPQFLKAFDSHLLDASKNWFDVTISHESIRKGFHNYLFVNLPVLHRPHGSRPWKQLKYTNPLKYYWLKFTKGLDKI